MERYTMHASNGSVRPIKSDTGEWVRYADITQSPVEEWAKKERERISKYPEEYNPYFHHMLFSDEELRNISQSNRG